MGSRTASTLIRHAIPVVELVRFLGQSRQGKSQQGLGCSGLVHSSPVSMRTPGAEISLGDIAWLSGLRFEELDCLEA